MEWLREFLSGVLGKRPPHLQVGAICLRQRGGRPQVLLITTLGTRRWIIPKGWPMRGRSLARAALQEAWEEAGITGRVSPAPIGSFLYDKIVDGGLTKQCEVQVFTIRTAAQAESYPEAGRRERIWLDPEDAAEKVREDGLKHILRGLSADSTVVSRKRNV
jgi:8-oxo-dGTP pyrophosphatase MutT (NUDIX family)